MTARLDFALVSRYFDGDPRPVLQAINLVLTPGSFTALVGPSGSGKSTLLHIAAGLDTAHEGDFALTPPKATLAYMFQQPRLLPWKTARENVALALEVRGVSRKEAAEQASDMLTRVGLGNALEVLPQQLSGGMQQRVALSRALVIKPDVLLMDEPFSALDELTAVRLRQELLTLWADSRQTVLMVTHNIAEACEMADRIIVFSSRPGRIIADFDVDITRPRSRSDPAFGALTERVLDAVEPGLVPPAQLQEAP